MLLWGRPGGASELEPLETFPALRGALDRNTLPFSTIQMMIMALEIVFFMLSKMTGENLSIGYVVPLG